MLRLLIEYKTTDGTIKTRELHSSDYRHVETWLSAQEHYEKPKNNTGLEMALSLLTTYPIPAGAIREDEHLPVKKAKRKVNYPAR